ncbi:MAG: carboxypeptidase regulatory-like domain-containing protein [Gemmatimonadaceae bacterium]
MLPWVATVVMTGTVDAQVVRGRVTERTTEAPLTGVLVELLHLVGDSAAQRAAATLSGADGTYALRAPMPGRYVLTAKRIGVHRFHSAEIELGEGETIARDLVIEALLFRLPKVLVTGLTTCDPNSDGTRVASLWEEARTALYATQISLRDRLFKAHVTRYVRELDPRTLRVLGETRSEVRSVVSRPFTVIDADSLSTRGYLFRGPDGGVTYYGPDAEVLLSDAFLRDHCFREVRAGRDRRGMIGLGFRPVPSRTLPDVVGVLWLDERTFELRLVEFTYSKVHVREDSAQYRGEVHFARLTNGAWIIRRWFIRLPVVARPAAPVSTEETTAPWVLVRPVTLRFREEGGEVAAEELLDRTAVVSILGMVRDSANRPLAGATVRVSGSRLAARSSENGTFSLDSLAYGAHTLVVEVPGYDSLGLAAVDGRIDITAQSSPRPRLRALNGRQLYARLCLGNAPRPGRGALRLSIRSPSGDSVVTGVPVAVGWHQRPLRSAGDSSWKLFELRTDDSGQITICDVPSGRDVTIVVARPLGGSEPARTDIVPDRGVRGIILRLTGR